MFSWVLNLLLLIVSLLVAGAPSSAQEANQILKGRCTRCHSEDRLKSQHLDLEGWLDMIERMRAYGANISKDEQMTRFLRKSLAFYQHGDTTAPLE